MLPSVKSTVEVAGERRAHEGDLDGPLIQGLKNLIANVIVVLEDSGCDGNGRGSAAVVDQSKSLLGHQRDAEDLQGAQVARFGDGHADVPTGEDPVTYPASRQVDQLADVTRDDAQLVAAGADPG